MDSRSLSLLAGTALSWGSSFLLIAVAIRRFDPIEVTFIRLALGALVLWVALAAMRMVAGADASGRITTVRERVGIATGGLLLAVPFTLIGVGEQHVDSGIAGIINATVPLWAAVLSLVVAAGERLTRTRVSGLAIGFCGVVMLMAVRVAQGNDSAPLSAYLVLVAAAACYAGLAVATRVLLSDVAPTRIAAWTCLVPAVFVGAWVGPRMELSDFAGWPLVAVLALGIVATGGGMFLYYQLLARVGPIRAATVNYLLPVLAIFYGVLLLDEHVRATDLAGLALVLCGVWIVGLEGRRASVDPRSLAVSDP